MFYQEKMMNLLLNKTKHLQNKLIKVLSSPSFKTKMKPLFYKYFKKSVSTKEGFHYYFLYNTLLSICLKSRGKEILSVGCGYGLDAICLSLLGARKLVGIDISPELIEGFNNLINAYPEYDISALLGDFLKVKLLPSSFDIVIVNEAISHIRDTDLLLSKIRFVLRSGGVLFISDSNNDCFFPSMLKSRSLWKKSENNKKPVEIAREFDQGSFIELRRKIVRDLNLKLNENQIKIIAQKTKGMYGTEIREAAISYLTSGKIAKKPTFPYRNPITGEYPELGFNPFSLMKRIEKYGFKSHLIKPLSLYLGKFSYNYLAGKVLSILFPILIRLSESLIAFLYPSIQIVAIKN